MKKRSIIAGLTLGLFVAYRRWKKQAIENAVVGDPEDLKAVGLSRDVFSALPRLSYLANGKPMEWMNLIIIGDEAAIKAAMEAGGWYEADNVTPWSLLKAFWVIIRGAQYLKGPMTPMFIDDQAQDLNYQKPTEENVFAKRHHARFWKTDQKDSSGAPVWIAHASFDKGIKGSGRFNFPPTHEIDADLDKERGIIAGDMVSGGAKLRGYIQFQPAGGGFNAFDDKFQSDGRAAVIEVGK
jgi:hypothetical protein